MLLHDLKLTDYLYDKYAFGNERQNLPGIFAILDPFKKIMTLHWCSCAVRVILQPSSTFHCTTRPKEENNVALGLLSTTRQQRSAETGRAY